MKALQLCQTKVRAKKLPMEVVDAEYQWRVDHLFLSGVRCSYLSQGPPKTHLLFHRGKEDRLQGARQRAFPVRHMDDFLNLWRY